MPIPQTGVPARAARPRRDPRRRLRRRRRASTPDAIDAAKAGGDLPIGPLGSGSDYSAFLQHLGIASLNLGFGGED